MKKPAQKTAFVKRDYLIVESGVADGDLKTLLDFLLGRPLDEREVRKAIVRLLLQQSCAETREVAAHHIATLFIPRGDTSRWLTERSGDTGGPPTVLDRVLWAVDFKRVDGGQSNDWLDHRVALLVSGYRAGGGTYNESIGLVAEKFNLSERRVQQIWAKYKDVWPYNRNAPEPHPYGIRSSEAR